MKKKLLCLCLLLSGIFAAAISQTDAIYTKEFAHVEGNITLYHPLSNKYIKYEIKKEFPDSQVVFHDSIGKVEVSGEAGALRRFNNSGNALDYQVSALFQSVTPVPAELKNIGLVFNGSYADYGGTGIDAISYVMKFDQAGALSIIPQGFHNYGQDDSYKTFDHAKSYPILSASEMNQFLIDHAIDCANELKMEAKVHKAGLNSEQSMVFLFLNGIPLNPEGTLIEHDYRMDHLDGNEMNNMIGMSTYQTKQADGSYVKDPIRTIQFHDLSTAPWEYATEVAQGIITPSQEPGL